MQAAVQTRYGSPDVVRIVEVDEPTIGATDVLVQVHATTVNRTDCACRAAKPFFMRLFTGLLRPRARVLGNEFAGVVVEVGQSVTAFSVGENVFGYNEGPFGAHAQFLAIPENGSLTTMPANLTYTEALPAPKGPTTPSPPSEAPRSREVRTSSSTVPRERSAQRRSSC
jgi:NADPH:quinone reductase-like Zn-dependent oxidoreductase